MENMNPSAFFDLDQFLHKDLFNSSLPVWEALKCIKEYLDGYSLGTVSGEVSHGAFLVNPEKISIGEGSIVEPGAYIKGPCVIGNNCTIRHGAYVRGNVITGDHCVLGHDSEFKNAVLMNHAHAAHFAYVGDTILGNRVNLGAGTVCANLKLDRHEIFVSVKGERVPSGLRKFGAILGDDVQTGCNSVINPGTVMGKESLCHPCSNFGGFIPARKTVKMDSRAVVVDN